MESVHIPKADVAPPSRQPKREPAVKVVRIEESSVDSKDEDLAFLPSLPGMFQEFEDALLKRNRAAERLAKYSEMVDLATGQKRADVAK